MKFPNGGACFKWQSWDLNLQHSVFESVLFPSVQLMKTSLTALGPDVTGFSGEGSSEGMGFLCLQTSLLISWIKSCHSPQYMKKYFRASDHLHLRKLKLSIEESLVYEDISVTTPVMSKKSQGRHKEASKFQRQDHLDICDKSYNHCILNK